MKKNKFAFNVSTMRNKQPLGKKYLGDKKTPKIHPDDEHTYEGDEKNFDDIAIYGDKAR